MPKETLWAAGHAWAVDWFHHRVLRWPLGVTPFDGYEPDLVVGQTSLNTASSRSGLANGLAQPTSIAIEGTRLFLSDRANNRVLIWNTLPVANDSSPNVVLGQANFATYVVNSGGLSERSLREPFGLAVSGNKLVVADTSNHRVLIWNSIPESNNDPAHVVLGQPDFLTATANTGGLSDRSLYAPSCVFIYSGKLFVCDRNNHRVLVWNSIPTTNYAPADLVIGQANFTEGSRNRGALIPSSATLAEPLGLTYAGNKFFVSDFANNRILVWNQLPTVSGAAADFVYGQESFEGADINAGGLSQQSLYAPIGLTLHGRDLWVADYNNQRLLRYSDAD
jgi:hypothetical protein